MNRKRVTAAALDGPTIGGADPEHRQAGQDTQSVSVFTEEYRSATTEPGLGDGHNVPLPAERLRIPGRHHGLVQPQVLVLEVIKQHGIELLRVGAGEGVTALPSNEDIQQ